MFKINSENSFLTVTRNIAPSTSTRGGSQTPSTGSMLPPPRPYPAISRKQKRSSSQSSDVFGAAHAQCVPTIFPVLSADLLPCENPILKARFAKLKRLKTAYEQEQELELLESWAQRN